MLVVIELPDATRNEVGAVRESRGASDCREKGRRRGKQRTKEGTSAEGETERKDDWVTASERKAWSRHVQG